MSTSKELFIYNNLPKSGGARELFRENIIFLRSRFLVNTIPNETFNPRNLLSYLYSCIIENPIHQIRLSKKYKNRNGIYIFYQSWLSKSNLLMRLIDSKKIYICHDVMREYYDDDHIKIQSTKERFINLLRLPIKYLDQYNLGASNLTIIANSQYSKKLIDNVYQVKTTVVYPGVDTAYFKPVNDIKKNQILSVGSINKLKGYDFLIRVISKVNQIIRPDLILIGNGGDSEYVNKLKNMASDLHVNLKILNNISRKILKTTYNQSKIFMYSPVSEPFGIVVLEAMASGLPIVAYKDGGGYSEILSNKNGYIIDGKDENVWASYILKLLTDNLHYNNISTYNLNYVNKYFDKKNMNINLLNIIKHL